MWSLLQVCVGNAVLYQLSGAGLDGVVHHFEKPWFTTLESALACWVSLILFSLGSWFMQSRKSGTSAEGNLSQPLLQVHATYFWPSGAGSHAYDRVHLQELCNPLGLKGVEVWPQ